MFHIEICRDDLDVSERFLLLAQGTFQLPIVLFGIVTVIVVMALVALASRF